MTASHFSVLVVDDQPDVVNGVIDGVNWESLGVQKVFPAYSVSEAKAIFRDHGVHLMLCDIEMPPQSGFELLRWARENHYGAECIFLSAHAEFEYAQEAVKLGGFDYILQPAPYEDIEAAVKKALDKIKSDHQVQQTYQRGLYWEQKEEMVAEGCFRAYLSGGQTLSQLLENLKGLEMPISPHETICPVLVQLLPSKGIQPFESGALREELRLIFTDGLGREDGTVLMIQMNPQEFLAILYRGTSDWIELPATLGKLIMEFQEQKGVPLACYMGDAIEPDGLFDEYQLLSRRRQDNVAGYTGVFIPSQKRQIQNYVYSFPNIEHWTAALAQGDCAAVRAEALHYLAHQKEQGAVNAEFLAKFHQDFIQMFFAVARSYESRTHDIFYEQYPFEDFLRAYTSYDKMVSLIEFAIGYIEGKLGASSERSPIEKAIDYIRQNIEKDLSRSEIAEAIFLNPEYLSRLFKKEMGVSLGDFILSEKMGIARSLLADTVIPVSLVASRVGYSNFSYFSQVFKKATGLSPVEYRQKNSKVK